MKRKLPLAETSGMAINNLKSNKFRSLLTMLGIVIGNASVITLVGVGRGAQNLAENQLSNLGANVLFVVPGNNDTRRRGVAFPKNLVLNDAMNMAKKLKILKQGDLVVETAGTLSGVSGSTDLVKVGIVSSDEESKTPFI